MDIKGQLRILEGRNAQDLNKVPEWARAEHMEMSVPLKELWTYSNSSVKLTKKLINEFLGCMRVFRKKRKQVIICHSLGEMNRRAEALDEQGYLVEREIGVQPLQSICFLSYQVRFWK